MAGVVLPHPISRSQYMASTPEMNGAPKARTVALLGSYVPRQCGIATFTHNLRDAIAQSIEIAETFVLGMDDTARGYSYGPEVRFQLQQSGLEDYRTAADLLNIHHIDFLSLQHEFGLYGGRAGEYVLA